MARPRDPALEAERRRQLLDATVELLAEDAFHSMTQEKVARRAGVSKGLLTYYFPTKDDLIVGAIEHYHGQQRVLFEALVEGPGTAAEKLRLLVAAAFPSRDSVEREIRFQSEVWSFAKDRPAARAAVVQSYRVFSHACARLLDAGAREGLVRAPDRVWAYRLIHALIDGLSFQLAVDPDLDLAELRARLELAIRTIVAAP